MDSVVECCLCGWTVGCADDLLFYPPPDPIYNKEWHHQWLVIIGHDNYTGTDATSSTDCVEKLKLVCSRHFEDNCFIEEYRLKDDALPTKFLPETNHQPSYGCTEEEINIPDHYLVSTSSLPHFDPTQAQSDPMMDQSLLDLQSNVSCVTTTTADADISNSFHQNKEFERTAPAFEENNFAQEIPSISSQSNDLMGSADDENDHLVTSLNENNNQLGNVIVEDELKPVVQEIATPAVTATESDGGTVTLISHQPRPYRKRKQLMENSSRDDEVPLRRMRLRSGTVLSDSTMVKNEIPLSNHLPINFPSPSRSITIALTDCIKEVERSTQQKDITHNCSFKLDDSGNIKSVIKNPTTHFSVYDEIAKLKAEVESLKKQAFLSSEIMTCFPSLVEKAKEYIDLINHIKSSSNPEVQALLSHVPSGSRETAASQEVPASNQPLLNHKVNYFPLSERELDNLALQTKKASIFIRKVMRRTFSADYLATETYKQMYKYKRNHHKTIVDATLKRFHLIQRAKGHVQKLTVNYIKHVMKSEFNVHHEAKKRF